MGVGNFLEAEFFGEGCYYEVVGVFDPFEDEFVGDIGLYVDGVPVFFVHVPAGGDAIVSFAEFNGFFGIAFKVDAFEPFDVGEGEYFAFDFIDECFGTEGEFFCYFWEGEAVFAELFDVHGGNLVKIMQRKSDWFLRCTVYAIIIYEWMLV